jgi:tetratricopeptide (TPR) repeat protein
LRPSARRAARPSLIVLAAIAALGAGSRRPLSARSTPDAVSSPVRAWEGHLDLPTYEEGLPDVNPPFDLFESRRFNYPYTLRHTLTDRRTIARWRTLHLENEYLKVTVLPDLGGHLYSCVDKATGEDLFYANTAIKKARVAYRGAWTALGIEFNFPVSHSWVTASPVDHALRTHPDGSATIWVGNQDRVYGMRWQVALTLQPRSTLLRQDVALYNRSDTRHRFYWWTNAGVRVWDDSRIEYPMRFTASHGFRAVDTWPVDHTGVDLSIVANHTRGPVSEFSHGSREAFMGVYHPRTKTGIAHYSSPLDAPTKKIWSWGSDPDGLDWRKALSEDESAYVEVQAGLFRNQETYAFLGPQEAVRFTEYWMPVRGTGGITRANPEGVLHVTRAAAGDGAADLSVAVNLNRPLAGGSVRVREGERVVRTEALSLAPDGVARHVFPGLPAAPRYTVEIADADGPRIAHTEDGYDMIPASDITVGPQPAHPVPPPDERSEGDLLEIGAGQELEGMRLAAWQTYADGLRRFPESLGLLEAAGRLAVVLHRHAEARPLLERALARQTSDAEVQYYLGLAHDALGDARRSRAAWEQAQQFGPYRAAALLKLAQADARGGDRAAALAHVREALLAAPFATRVGALEVSLLRHTGRRAEALERVRAWREIDPTSSLLRHEAALLGEGDAALLAHLGADPDRVLDLAAEYMAAGHWADALGLLEREYPRPEGFASEPGAMTPQEHPEVAYYRAWCREQLGDDAGADYRDASRRSTRYVFPHRAESLSVLRRALAVEPRDATARFLLGSLHLAGGRVEDAVREWKEARRLDASLPVLHRNLGRTLLFQGDVEGALAAFLEGMAVDTQNVDLYEGADQALAALGRPAAERVAALRRFPNTARMPPSLAQRLALALADAGRGDEAVKVLASSFFAREEGGTNVRQVWVDVRLHQALALARAGRGQEALALIEALDREVPGVPFTKDGLAVFVRSPRVQYMAGEVAALAGDTAAARRHFEQAEKAREGARTLPWSYAAARQLGGHDEARWREPLETTLADTEKLLRQGSGPGGQLLYAQGLLLRALGREDDARERFRRALLAPDQQLSHFLSGRALQGARPF